MRITAYATLGLVLGDSFEVGATLLDPNDTTHSLTVIRSLADHHDTRDRHLLLKDAGGRLYTAMVIRNSIDRMRLLDGEWADRYQGG